jgi:hypothetical protein
LLRALQEREVMPVGAFARLAGFRDHGAARSPERRPDLGILIGALLRQAAVPRPSTVGLDLDAARLLLRYVVAAQRPRARAGAGDGRRCWRAPSPVRGEPPAGRGPLGAPLSTTWMSHVDPSRAERELGFAHPPLDAYLAAIVGELMTGWPAAPPPGLEHRSAELAWS